MAGGGGGNVNDTMIANIEILKFNFKNGNKIYSQLAVKKSVLRGLHGAYY